MGWERGREERRVKKNSKTRKRKKNIILSASSLFFFFLSHCLFLTLCLPPPFFRYPFVLSISLSVSFFVLFLLTVISFPFSLSLTFQIATHVISSIVHIAHKYDNDSEPWPIQIEDHQGNLHSVALQPGQVRTDLVYYCIDLSSTTRYSTVQQNTVQYNMI